MTGLPPHPLAEPILQSAGRESTAARIRPVLTAIARMISTDRRAVVLANRKGEILLANAAAQRLPISQETLLSRLDWPQLCTQTDRAGSTSLGWQQDEQNLDGELVLVPLGVAQGTTLQGYLLRLAESDQESTWLRNRTRAAALMRVAHDLRTPIQSLLASADLLIRGAGPETGGSAELAGMRRAAALSLEHIGNVLAVIRGDKAGGGSQSDEDFRIADELNSLIQMVTPIARAHATEISLDIDAPEGLTLHGPLRFVRALCQNLIDNSVNHGGGRVAVMLQCRPVSGKADMIAAPVLSAQAELWQVRLELRDEGGGLPEAARLRLAEALGGSGGDATSGMAAAGNRPSAGMNVLAHALRQLGGQMTLADLGSNGERIAPVPGQDRPGRVIGTLFEVSFSLPRAPEMRMAEPVAASDAKAELQGRHILLVEDSPSSRDWLVHMLRSHGAEVTAAGSGPEALALMSRAALSHPVDLILSDVTLPRMSGIELTSLLRAGNGAAAQAWTGPIVGLSAHADDRIRAACLEAGMNRILEKPVKPAALCAMLAAILQGNDQATAGRSQAQTKAAPKVNAPISAQTLADMIEHMGAAPALAFITRAMDEAQIVHDELQLEGPGPDTGRRLHAATGAAGLTGLVEIERQLRALEAAAETGSPQLPKILTALELALAQARSFAGTLQI